MHDMIEAAIRHRLPVSLGTAGAFVSSALAAAADQAGPSGMLIGALATGFTSVIGSALWIARQAEKRVEGERAFWLGLNAQQLAACAEREAALEKKIDEMAEKVSGQNQRRYG